MLFALALTLAALPDLPLPPGTTFNADTATEVSFAELAVKDDGKPVKVRGHRWRAYADGETKGAALWAKWLPLLRAKGWKSTFDEDGHSLKRVDGKTDWRALVTTPDYDAPLVVVVRAGGAPMKLDVKPPAPNAPPVKDEDDFPFAPVFPGQKRSGSSHAATPFVVTGKDARFVADETYVKTYLAPPTLSRLEAVLAAADALQRAGWDVATVNEDDGYVQAHWAKNGRDVWLHVSHREDGTDQALSFGVVDLGEEDPGKALDAACKLTLRGVTFEFNKATLKPESELTLSLVAKALTARKSLVLEVAGHTDSQGGDSYNQKLSEARAASVASWLASHGVAKERLAAKGYGETRPIAENGTEDGRAKNRRVEISCVK